MHPLLNCHEQTCLCIVVVHSIPTKAVYKDICQTHFVISYSSFVEYRLATTSTYCRPACIRPAF